MPDLSSPFVKERDSPTPIVDERGLSGAKKWLDELNNYNF